MVLLNLTSHPLNLVTADAEIAEDRLQQMASNQGSPGANFNNLSRIFEFAETNCCEVKSQNIFNKIKHRYTNTIGPK